MSTSNLLSYQAVSSSGVSLVEKLFFLLFILKKKTTPAIEERLTAERVSHTAQTLKTVQTFVNSCALARLSTAMAKKTFSSVSVKMSVKDKNAKKYK